MRKVELYCLRIDDNEIKTTDLKERSNFIRMYGKNPEKGFRMGMVIVPEDRVESVKKNVSVDKLLDWWGEKVKSREKSRENKKEL